MIGSAAERKAHDRSGKGREINPEVGQTEIPDEELHHQRYATKQDDISIGQSGNQAAAIDPQGTGQNADAQTQDRRRHDQLDTDLEPLPKSGQDFTLDKCELFHSA